jgi:hypothetical protein
VRLEAFSRHRLDPGPDGDLEALGPPAVTARTRAWPASGRSEMKEEEAGEAPRRVGRTPSP